MILCNGQFKLLLDQFGVLGFDENDLARLDELNRVCLDGITATGGVLPIVPPLEKHPYLRLLVPDSDTRGLMIGTFPPISYLCDTLQIPKLVFNGRNISRPDYPFFHGNMGALWNYSPIDLDFVVREKFAQRIIQRLKEHKLVYTDMIAFCQRALAVDEDGDVKYTAADTLLNNIVIHEQVYPFIMNSDQLNRLYFTNSSFFSGNSALLGFNGLYRLKERDAFSLFLKGAQDLGYKIAVSTVRNAEEWIGINEGPRPSGLCKQINSLLSNKILLNLRLSRDGVHKVFKVYSALSPAAVNRGMVRRNQCVQKFSKQYISNIADSPAGLLSMVLAAFFAGHTDGLGEINV